MEDDDLSLFDGSKIKQEVGIAIVLIFFFIMVVFMFWVFLTQDNAVVEKDVMDEACRKLWRDNQMVWFDCDIGSDIRFCCKHIWGLRPNLSQETVFYTCQENVYQNKSFQTVCNPREVYNVIGKPINLS